MFESDLGEWKALTGGSMLERQNRRGRSILSKNEEREKFQVSVVKSKRLNQRGDKCWETRVLAGAHAERPRGGHTWPRVSLREPGLRARLPGSLRLLPFPPSPLCARPPHLQGVRRERYEHSQSIYK